MIVTVAELGERRILDRVIEELRANLAVELYDGQDLLANLVPSVLGHITTPTDPEAGTPQP